MTATPQRLGRYELLERLGEGGMGAVWLARLSGAGGFEKLCIVKTVLPSIAGDQQFLSRFHHEGRVLTALQHANIAQVHDLSEDQGTLFLALEYVPGVDLARLHDNIRREGQTLPLPVAVYVVQQAAEGLGFAHRKTAVDGSPLGIVHRDVSPQNLMVSYDGEVKVIDFGIAKSEARSRSTAQASVMGKLGYMAPEQARGEPVDHRADQYAAGVILWELLANEPYVPRGTLTEMVVAMARPKRKPLAPLRPEVSSSLEGVVLRTLSDQPDERYPSTDDLAAALMQELLRLSALPSKRQVGEFVRAHCPSELAAQQTLLTRVGTLRATGEVVGAGSVITQRATPAVDSVAATYVRAGDHGPGSAADSPTSPGRPSVLKSNSSVSRTSGAAMTTAELSALAVPRGRGWRLIVVGTFLALVVLTAVLAGPTLVGAARRSASSGSPPTAEPSQPPSAPVSNGLPAAVPHGVVSAVEGQAPREAPVVEVYRDGDTWFARAGNDRGVLVGQTLKVFGRKGSGGTRAHLGMATVVEVLPAVARLALDATAGAAAGERYVALADPSPPPASESRPPSGPPAPPPDESPTASIEVKRAVELFDDADQTWARAGKAEGLQPGQLLTVVGAEQAGRRPKLGTATVMEVRGLISRVRLDAQATSSPGPRYAAIGLVKESVSSPTPGTSRRSVLTARLRLQTTPVWAIVLHNTSGFGWSNCTVFIPGQKRGTLKSLPNGFLRELDLRFFTDDPSAPVLTDAVQVRCKEGSATFPAK